MRILVAGGQGQIGSALAELSAMQGVDLIALGRADLDITDAQSIHEAFSFYRPDFFINSAAYTAVDKAESEPEQAYAINQVAVALLADACAEADIPMLHISTDYVFDGSKEGLYTEEDEVHPLAVYAKSKETGEKVLRERLQRHIILRTSWVFGEQGSNFVKTIMRLAKERDSLNVVADQFGGPSSARAISQVLLTIAARYKAAGEIAWGTYHFCQKPYVSWCQFAKAILDRALAMGLIDRSVVVNPIPSSAFPTLVVRPSNSRLDTRKIELEFGVKSSSWSDSLSTVLKMYAE